MSTEKTQDVLDHHMSMLLSGNIDGILEDYTEGSVFISNLGGPVIGLAALRSVFAAAALPGFETTATHIEGEFAYITWKADAVSFGSDTFVVTNGKITLQTVALVFA